MKMDIDLAKLTDRFFDEELGTSLERLLSPVSQEYPAGESLRGSDYDGIREARREDDPSIPQGAWQYELKRADWPKVARLCIDALETRSKDLQLAAWLLESQIRLNGFKGIAPCLTLMQGLCERYWEDLHPCFPGDENHESRTNIILWINSSMLPILRQVPIAWGNEGKEYGWCDWELAHRYDQSRSAGRRKELEGELSISVLSAALAVTHAEDVRENFLAISAALQAISGLGKTLDERFVGESPSLAALRELLANIGGTLEGELGKRGHLSRIESVDEAAEEEEGQGLLAQAMADRAEAYACLDSAADFLMRLEPHSPVPYLVRRAIEWGNLNTVELYQELFVKMNGQISIFDLLGIGEGGGR